MANQNQNMAEPHAARDTAPGNGFFGTLLSMLLFGGLGAAVGHYLGKLGEKSGHTNAQRLIMGAGALVGGLLAYASRSQPVAEAAEPPPVEAPVAQSAPIATTALHMNTQPALNVEAAQAQAHGTLAPAHIGERTV